MTKWHPGELYPRVGFIVTNLSRPAERVVGFCNQRRTAEQWIKEGKNAMKWTRLSCSSFAANAVRIQLHALAYNLANFMRAPALPEAGGGGSKGYQRETCASMAGNRAISGLRSPRSGADWLQILASTVPRRVRHCQKQPEWLLYSKLGFVRGVAAVLGSRQNGF